MNNQDKSIYLDEIKNIKDNIKGFSNVLTHHMESVDQNLQEEIKNTKEMYAMAFKIVSKIENKIKKDLISQKDLSDALNRANQIEISAMKNCKLLLNKIREYEDNKELNEMIEQGSEIKKDTKTTEKSR